MGEENGELPPIPAGATEIQSSVNSNSGYTIQLAQPNPDCRETFDIHVRAIDNGAHIFKHVGVINVSNFGVRSLTVPPPHQGNGIHHEEANVTKVYLEKDQDNVTAARIVIENPEADASRLRAWLSGKQEMGNGYKPAAHQGRHHTPIRRF